MRQWLDQLFGAERTLYLDEVEPTLCDGMNFLGGNGKVLGSYSNRYVCYINLNGNFLEKSYITGKPIGLFMQGQAAIFNLIVTSAEKPGPLSVLLVSDPILSPKLFHTSPRISNVRADDRAIIGSSSQITIFAILRHNCVQRRSCLKPFQNSRQIHERYMRSH
ncbi:hypothetical protein ACQZ44_17625 [Agrobacterium vitis]